MKTRLKIIILLFFTLNLFLKLEAQDYSLVKTIPIKAVQIQVDKFDMLYIIEDYKITQYNTKGVLLNTYNNIDQGEISKFDVSNPLKPIVLYEDYNVVVILDNKLGIINTIDLNELNLNQISEISIPNTMQFWVFDKIETRLKLYDKNFNMINQSEHFLQLFDHISETKSLKISNNFIYLLDSEGIKVFDQFGTYVKKYTIQNLNDFQIFNNQLVYFKDNTLKSIHEFTLEEKTMPLMAELKNIEKALILKNYVFIQTPNFCTIYSIK